MHLRMYKTHFLIVPMLVSALLLQSCGMGQVTADLQAVIAAAEAAVSVLSTTGGIDPLTANRIEQYLMQVSQATSFASTELASTDSPGVMAGKIVSQFAAITAPDFGSGTAQSIIAATIAAVNVFLKSLPALPTSATSSLSARAARAPTAAATTPLPKSIKVSAGDRKTLASVKERADALVVKIAQLPPKK